MVCSCSRHCQRTVRSRSCRKYPSVGAQAISPPTRAWARSEGRMGPPRPIDPTAHHAHRRSPPWSTPWKTQCAQSILPMAECLSMECHSIDRMSSLANESCAGLGAHSGQSGSCSPLVGAGSRPPSAGARSAPAAPVHPLRSGPRPVTHPPGGSSTDRTDTMGPFGVDDIEAPEVKFLDRCEIDSSEGALQVRVRRSRMRVWGAKMIRHRRSPAP